MVLCAGLGTRLRPLTGLLPKPAVPLLGRPLISLHLALLEHAGIREVAINTHHLPDVMAGVAEGESRRLGVSLTVHREELLLGTGGGIRGLRGLLEGGPFVVLNGDTLFTLDLAEAIAAHRASGAAATMVVLPMPEGSAYAAVEADVDGWVRSIAGFGPGGSRLVPWHFGGVHVMEPEVFEHMADVGPEDVNREIYPRLMAAGLEVHAHVVRDAYWSDLGTPERYLGTVRDLLFGRADLQALGASSPLAGVERRSTGVLTRGSPKVEGRVTGPSLFEDGAWIQAGARIGTACYVGARSVIESGASINRSVVLDDTRIRAGEHLEDCVAFGEGRMAAGQAR